MNALDRKNTGSYYTCDSIADYIAKWAIDSPEICVLEPSFGDGIFIDSAISRFAELGNSKPDIIGVEMQKEPYDLYMKNHADISGYIMDFMDYDTDVKIDAIIGNPPYIRLNKLKPSEREKVLSSVRSAGVDMQPNGSLWMPFIIHSTELLRDGGKLGFVLPYEITYVQYAFDLWKYLAKKYGKITICRIHNDFFPDVDVETIIFLAEKRGMSTDNVYYMLFDTVSSLYNNDAYNISIINIDDIINLKKPFERELIPEKVISFLDLLRRNKKLTELVYDCKFKIGYVTGNKGYFHLSEENIQKYKIRQENRKKSLVNAKQISANIDVGVETSPILNHSYLFYPVTIGDGEIEYIKHGEVEGINKGYKCKVRNPWFLTPGLEIPDVVLTVFGDVPKLLLNDGKFYISNSLLGGFSKVKNCKELICRWYNSLTLLSIETTIHSLGGGTFVFIPGETDKLEIISDFPADKIEIIYERISDYARNNLIEDVYKYGDNIVLKDIYGFSDEEIDEIKSAVSILRSWRIPEKRRE